VQVSNKNVGGQFHSACSQRSLEAPGHQHCIFKDRLDRLDPNTVVKARELSFKEKIKITSESQSDKRPRGLNADAFLILSLQ